MHKTPAQLVGSNGHASAASAASKARGSKKTHVKKKDGRSAGRRGLAAARSDDGNARHGLVAVHREPGVSLNDGLVGVWSSHGVLHWNVAARWLVVRASDDPDYDERERGTAECGADERQATRSTPGRWGRHPVGAPRNGSAASKDRASKQQPQRGTTTRRARGASSFQAWFIGGAMRNRPCTAARHPPPRAVVALVLLGVPPAALEAAVLLGRQRRWRLALVAVPRATDERCVASERGSRGVVTATVTVVGRLALRDGRSTRTARRRRQSRPPAGGGTRAPLRRARRLTSSCCSAAQPRRRPPTRGPTREAARRTLPRHAARASRAGTWGATRGALFFTGSPVSDVRGGAHASGCRGTISRGMS